MKGNDPCCDTKCQFTTGSICRFIKSHTLLLSLTISLYLHLPLNLSSAWAPSTPPSSPPPLPSQYHSHHHHLHQYHQHHPHYLHHPKQHNPHHHHSDTNSVCCTNCAYSANTTVCRHTADLTTSCQLDATCNGTGPDCPPSLPKPNGQACIEKFVEDIVILVVSILYCVIKTIMEHNK